MRKIIEIREKNPVLQLELFLSALKENLVPVILPQKFDSSRLGKIQIPPEAEFAVCSSGTTGKPKLYFRTLKSWQNFIPEQNQSFGITPMARFFINGSLAFTGNLNIALTAFLNGNYLYNSKDLRPQRWAREIVENEIDTIYMIPDKLYYLAKMGTFSRVKTIVSGSQSVSPELFARLKKSFPCANIFLYYGTSETSYISYKRLCDETSEDSDCVGKVFDSVKIKINEENHILVKSPWGICGTQGYFDTNDCGTLKNGLLYLFGRADDVINIHGQKINKAKIEKCLLSISQIEEVKISVEEIKSIKSVIAHIAGNNLPEKIDENVFSEIEPVFIPKKIIRYEKLPRNESGKVCIK